MISPTASRRFPMVLGDTAGVTGAPISSLCVYYGAVQNLVYGCGNVPHTTVECSDTPPIHQYVHPASRKPIV